MDDSTPVVPPVIKKSFKDYVTGIKNTWNSYSKKQRLQFISLVGLVLAIPVAVGGIATARYIGSRAQGPITPPISGPDLPWLQIDSPSGDQTFTSGQDVSITWSSFQINQKIGLELVDVDSHNTATIASQIDQSVGKFVWTVPSTWYNGINRDSFRIRIYTDPDRLVTAIANGFYTVALSTSTPTPIPGSFIRVTHPNGDEIFNTNQTDTITWDMGNGIQSTDVYLVTDTNIVVTKLPLNPPFSNTSLTWYPYNYGYTDSKFKIKLVAHQAYSLPDLVDFSDVSFTILPIPSPTPTPVPTPIPTCNIADINKDGVVNQMDVDIVTSAFFMDVFATYMPDINHDGIVDIIDYSIVVKNLNSSTGACEQ